ncbi:uncharacterized protein VP01_2753g3 [Puccinia sorghi]|uniref:CCHC-type domain-containing protein n=1 Tax=Puccinia sorghi TaxID=27349 RepID=A0A0L6V313_9BASI|nr:uncharacterized protein VP01_2753g3 [Puccinia sorghi]
MYFVKQIGLHAFTYPKRFPNNSSKVVFAILFMKNYAANFSQPYLTKFFKNQWSSWSSSMMSSPASLTTTVTTAPKWPCGTSARLALCWLTPRTSTHTPALFEDIEAPESMQEMALKSGQTIKGIRKWVQMKLCFHCGQAGHVFCVCFNMDWRPQGHQEPSPSLQISKLQAEINWLHTNPNPRSPTLAPENAGFSKNGATQV